MIETTALGAAFLAGLAIGPVRQDEDRRFWWSGATYEASADRATMAERRSEWQRAVRRVLLD